MTNKLENTFIVTKVLKQTKAVGFTDLVAGDLFTIKLLLLNNVGNTYGYHTNLEVTIHKTNTKHFITYNNLIKRLQNFEYKQHMFKPQGV